MENASKALLISGGVLVALIIVSAMVYMFNAIGEMPRSQEEIKAQKELEDFNKKYESYNRGNLKGTDVISVLYMADNNNEKYKGDTQFYITVEIEITKPIDQTVRKYKLENNRWVLDSTYTDASGKRGTQYGGTLSGCYRNTLGKQKYSSNGIIPNTIKDGFKENVEDNSNTEVNYKIKLTDAWQSTLNNEEAMREKSYYTMNKVVKEFKRRKFKCEEIEHDTNTGRINYMYFVEE